VVGDLDLVAPLTLAGIACDVVARPGDPARYSRHTRVVGWADPWTDPDDLLELLLRYAAMQNERPVLFYQSDASTLFVSRHRDDLATAFRFVVGDASLIEDVLDKLRFRDLAERLELPVPPSQVLRPVAGSRAVTDLTLPLVVKPATRGDPRWTDVDAARKAVRVDTIDDLERIWDRLVAFGSDVLMQEVVPGPETRIESYHCYVDQSDTVAAEFTGVKLRTKPVEYGHTTALMTTDAPDVLELGRDITARLGFRGVAKLDFKRAPDGALRLLEVNPRFNLWHHPGAIAGVNIPAVVWADLAGRPRPGTGPARPGVSWCSPWDLQAAREWGVPLRSWVPWVARCEARSMMALDDPRPFVRLSVQRLQRAVAGHRR
jgi:predicted ATP-grasp superfamily ATP-dependent carboligase